MPALSRADLIAMGVLAPTRYRRGADDVNYIAHAEATAVARLPTPGEVMAAYRARMAGMDSPTQQPESAIEATDDDTAGRTR